jgi:branched-chain amino acid transport system substrate-binding protein
LWAETAGVRLLLTNDHGARDAAVHAYAAWVGDSSVDLLLGPYASGLVRAVAPLAREVGRLLWNHGGSADDLAAPGVVCLAAPASSYFDAIVDEAVACQVNRLVIVQGAGPFARIVAQGATNRATTRGLDVRTIDAAALDAEQSARTAFVVVGRFEHDIEVTRHLRSRQQSPTLVGAVAAGLPAFGQELGEAAEGVLGPVQWWPDAKTPAIGPSGVDFAAGYQHQTGEDPSYPAAQAAAAGYLAHAAHRLGLTTEDIPRWATSTLLGDFALDATWRQIGHRVTTIRWQHGRMIP